MKKFIFKRPDALELRCYLYEPETKPIGSVLIIHGMQEHAKRYSDFANFLVDNGYAVLAPDLRGHGMTAQSVDRLGYDKGDIYKNTIGDLVMMEEWLKKSYSVPVFVFAHSYGSMLAQRLMQVTDVATKYVLCGTGNGSSALMKFANKVTKMLARGKMDKKATAVENLSIKSYGKKFKNGNWLTRDEEVFKKYNEDEFCGGDFPYSFYVSLFSNLRECNKHISEIPDKTEIFLIAGTKDPVGQNGKQVKALFKEYKKANKKAYIMLYKDCRHELINELNKKDIYNDIQDFYRYNEGSPN